MTTIISSREFNQDVSRAKRCADAGPVIITDRGKPAWVLLRHETYRELTGKGQSIADMLAMDEEDPDVDFEPPKSGDGLFKAAEF
jgi:Antitoxin Phd_YefM, type II toxin-antitoxin system